SDDGVTTSLQLSRNSKTPMLDHQDKYMMKAQVVDPYLGNNKWYQSLLRSFDQKKNNIQVQQNLFLWPSQDQVQRMSKLTRFESASKDLDTLLGSQRSDKNKEGLEHSAVPPPAQVYSPPKKDISWTGLPNIVDDTITNYNRPSSSIETKFPKVIKTNKVETARKPSVKYAEMYRNTLKSPKVRGKTWPKNNFAHKNVTPRADLFKTASVSAARRVNTAAPRPNVNSARQKTTQDLVIIKLIQRVKRLERELKARTPPTKFKRDKIGRFSEDKKEQS
nr:hypothetical protein [Tanacetum cinerariifolium]